MVSAVLAEFRAELEAALAILNPQVRGLEDLNRVSLSNETLAFVRQEIDDHSRRRTLCDAVIGAMNALEADGYPDTPKAEVPAGVFVELQEQLADLTAATDEFEQMIKASSIVIDLGPITDKP